MFIKSKVKLSLFFFLLASIFSVSFAQQLDQLGSPLKADPYLNDSPIPLFNSDSILSISLKSDFPFALKQTKGTNPLPASLSYNENGQVKNFNVIITTRGNWKSQYCPFLPLKINFENTDKTLLKNSLFEKVGSDIKFANVCSTFGPLADNSHDSQMVVREQMVYKMLNRLGLPSLKTRLVRVKYYNLTNQLVGDTIGFFIETPKAMTQRLGFAGHLSAQNGVSHNYHITASASVHFLMAQAIFLDSDHFPHRGKNTIPVTNELGEILDLVPYDFDQTHFVRPNGTWARQAGDIQGNLILIKDLLESQNRQVAETARQAIERMLKNKAQVYAAIHSHDLLDSKTSFLNIMNQWYEAIFQVTGKR